MYYIITVIRLFLDLYKGNIVVIDRAEIRTRNQKIRLSIVAYY